jgi:hypothetical protein
MSEDAAKLHQLLAEVKSIAARYYAATGRPLGVTCEVGEYEAAARLGLTLAPVRTPAFDATRRTHNGEERIQIKTRAVTASQRYRGRCPSIKFDKPFESVVLVLLDKESYDPIEIWEAPRDDVFAHLTKPGSRSRNERGSMGLSQFKSIAKRVWPDA